MEETNILNEEELTHVSNQETKNTPIEVVAEFDPEPRINNTTRKGKSPKFAVKLKSWKDNTSQKFRSSYAKRNVITNIILSLYLFLSILMALFYLYLSFAITLMESISLSVIYSAFLIPHILFLLHTHQFVVLNWKESVYKSYISLFFSLIPYVLMFLALYTPDDEASNEVGMIATVVLALVLTLLVMPVISIALRFRKYGASAKMMLDVPRDKSRRFFNYKKILYVLAFCTCYLSIPILLKVASAAIIIINNYDPNYKSANNAEIGDYFYEDGTLSSELRSDKKCIGVVYSLELTDYEKELGYSHGHIMALNDEEKTKWNSDFYDPWYFPNYTWENRRDALNDKNGLEYYYLDQENAVEPPDLYHYRFNVDMYSSVRSIWYVPTAGEWCDILKNLGDVEVNEMLAFDSETASANLSKYNINELRWYWTATDYDEFDAWSMRIKNGEFGSKTPKDNDAYLRLVAAF